MGSIKWKKICLDAEKSLRILTILHHNCMNFKLLGDVVDITQLLEFDPKYCTKISILISFFRDTFARRAALAHFAATAAIEPNHF